MVGFVSKIVALYVGGGVITEVKRCGNAELARIGESDTRNDAEVVANDASPCCTGVYGEEPTVVFILSRC